MSKVKILVVEDDAVEAMDIQETLESFGYDVPAVTPSGADTLEKIDKYNPDLVLMDIALKGEINGIECARIIKNQFNIPVVHLTAQSEEGTIQKAKLTEPYGYLTKPLDETELKPTIEVALYKHDMETAQKENEEKYRSLFLRSGNAIFLTTIDGRILDANPAAFQLFGYTKEELKDIGRDALLDRTDPHHKDIWKKRTFEATHIRKNGTKFLAEVSKTFFKDFKGEQKVFITIKDITERKRAEEALRESEERFRLLVETASEGIVILDRNGTIVEINESALKLSGFKREDVIGKNFIRFIPQINMDIKEVFSSFNDILMGKSPAEHEWIMINKRGERITLNVHRSVLKRGGKIIGASFILNDITELKKAEDRIKEEYRRLVDIIDFLPDATFVIDKEGKIIAWNRALEQITDMKSEDMIGKSDYSYALPFYGEPRPMLIDLVLSHDKEIESRFDYLKRKGDTIYAENFAKNLYDNRGAFLFKKASPIYDSEGNISGAIESIRDITEHKQAEYQIKASLKEKETLLREIHHRVKNNLQILSSLMNLQTRYVDDEESISVLRESQNRVKSMAIVHELLYQTESLSEINLSRYVPGLVSYLFDSYAIDPKRIKFKMEMEDVLFNIDTAIPCGLIINELVSNSLKHAFPEGREGEITIKIQSTDDEYTLSVSDDGVSFPEDLDFQNTNSLGLRLVNSLTSQIDGKIELDKSHGTKLKITFKELEYERRL